MVGEEVTRMTLDELCARPEAVLESKTIVIDESATIEPRNHSVEPVRRFGAKARMLMASMAALATTAQETAAKMTDHVEALRAHWRQREIMRRSREQKFTRYISRTGEPHGRSGDKLIRKAMRKQVGRAVLR